MGARLMWMSEGNESGEIGGGGVIRNYNED